MMNKFNISYKRISALKALIAVAFIVVLLPSCQKKIDAVEEWRRQNENAFNDYADNKNFTKQTTDGLLPFVYMRWIEKGTGTEYPIETSRVLVHYECYLLTGSKSFIEGNFDQEKSQRFTLNRAGEGATIVGVQVALQNMVVGDYTEVIIPWYLAYGSKQEGNIQPYSSLRFLLRLDKIIPETEK
ncbi:FKBP-type peptidyl-prolyl cis-trans isomerase [Porphyromonas circumdentaria]|uniref:Peptidyl-prolyl cis-trans isomerase n=1 Tax=Porphyromonas circumdentaria TaxID=29524 RepID=A0A1T4P4G4_9PORP|nr:FKBP-type peptidyl-prolyl cis-trans isomerase [Porphyromonas circumdentaria]MBB6276325.1 peptidylprolyl isomerase [Porphyromonas circumdentaria]MDO4722594.1 FKBP-type peptidyl-prolyl cis-trans isomerase [Porphyromonas circumdentaria]SJZ86339.1 peptidylprolyl isomerase [Porphyromonas circumdentaria]